MATARVFVPADAAAVSVGADEVAAAFETAGAQVVRTGSRGMLWLEPLVELETDAGRVGYANAAPGDVAGVLAGEATDIGVVDQHPWLTSQQRVSFARVGVVEHPRRGREPILPLTRDRHDASPAEVTGRRAPAATELDDR